MFSPSLTGLSFYKKQGWNRKYAMRSTEICDPRTLDFFLMNGGTWIMIAILITYFVFITKFGPKWMSNRKPFELRQLMLVYNVVVAAINVFFVYQSVLWLDFGTRLLDFNFPDYNDRRESTMRVINMLNYYMLTKMVDLIDTIFFVLRKKDSQITFLHIYHHISVPIVGWVSPLMPGVGLFTLVNCTCHVIMYLYYALAAFGPSVQKYLWWKRYITQIQLTQFILFLIYSIILFIKQSNYPSIYIILPLSQSMIFLGMFAKFYIKSYKKNRKTNNTD